MVITGGYPGKTRVSTYQLSGFISDLPFLNTGRFAHACSFYETDDGTKVDDEAGGSLMVECVSADDPGDWREGGVRSLHLHHGAAGPG